MRKHAQSLALGLLVFFALVLTLYFEPPDVILGPYPISGWDWQTHWQQCVRVYESWKGWGQTWSYDPHLLAGQITGAIFDADNKLYEVFFIAMVELGLPKHIAFNLFPWLVYLSVPPVFYASARLLGLARRTAIIALGIGLLLFFFDSFARYLSWVGMISWVYSGLFWILPFSLFYAFTEHKKARYLVVLAPVLAYAHMIHPYSFITLAPAMTYMYIRERKALSRAQHAGVWAVAIVTVLANSWWLYWSLRFWHYILDSGVLLDATPDFILYDFLGLTKEPEVTGLVGVRTSFRFTFAIAAGITLYRWRKAKDRRFVPFAIVGGVLFVVVYMGHWFWLARQVQPYRFLLPLMVLLIVPAAEYVESIVLHLRQAKLDRTTWGFVALLAVVLVPRYVRDVLYFIPDLVPKMDRRHLAKFPNTNGPPELSVPRWPEPLVYRKKLKHPQPYSEFANYVNQTDDGNSRWLVEFWMLGEHLAAWTDAEIIGGFGLINLAHSDANLFRRVLDGKTELTREALNEYFVQYNIKWVVISDTHPVLERQTDLLERVAVVEGAKVYRVLTPLDGYVVDGPGTVKSSLNKLEVRGTNGGNLTLRYHYHEMLKCRPNCTVKRVPANGDRVGFIGVEGAPRDFEIYNAYTTR
jgi:hypothetical protein